MDRSNRCPLAGLATGAREVGKRTQTIHTVVPKRCLADDFQHTGGRRRYGMVDVRQYDSKGPSTRRRRKRGQQNQALGRSRGGFSTKIHSSVDALGNPTRFILTGGEQSDYKQALNLLKDQSADFVLADKGYDADYIIGKVLSQGAEAVIPLKILPQNSS